MLKLSILSPCILLIIRRGNLSSSCTSDFLCSSQFCFVNEGTLNFHFEFLAINLNNFYRSLSNHYTRSKDIVIFLLDLASFSLVDYLLSNCMICCFLNVILSLDWRIRLVFIIKCVDIYCNFPNFSFINLLK